MVYRHRQSLYSLLNQLKRDGLVRKKQPGRNTIWNITPRGRIHLVKIGMRRSRRRGGEQLVFPSKKKYIPKPAKDFIIVAFDITETERKRRDWLRSCLVGFGFSQLQKSVWVGNWGIPEEFLRDLKDLKMFPCVHIFSVSKRGTITEIAQKSK